MLAFKVTAIGELKHYTEREPFGFGCLMNMLPEGIIRLGLHLLCYDSVRGVEDTCRIW